MTTQPVLTDDQIRTIITDAHQSHGAFKTGYGLSLGRAIETAVLSKLRAPVADERAASQIAKWKRSSELLDAVQDGCWDVRFLSSTNGDAGDSSIGIEIVAHFMAAPRERVIGENWSENLRAALEQAMTADTYPPARPERASAPVADESLAVQALKAAQNNIAVCRPPGSSDPKSPQYDHDAFMWDYYQRAIDSLALASAPVAEPVAVVRDNPEDYGTIIDPLAVLPVGTLLYAGAPVAGEEQPVAECERCGLAPEDHTELHWCDNQSFRLGDAVQLGAAPQASSVAGEAIAGYMVGTDYFRPDVLAAARIYAENRGLAVRPLVYGDAAPQASEADIIEDVAKQWDGCIYDAGPGGDIDIGKAIRNAASKHKGHRALKSTPAPTAAEDSQASEAVREPSAGDVVAVLVYRSKGRLGAHGQTLGADGAGEFAVVYRGDEFAALVKANEEIRALEAAGHRLDFAAIIHGEGYSGPMLRQEYVNRAALSARKDGGQTK